MQKHCHSGARALPASPESRNTDLNKSMAWPVFMVSGPGPDGPSRNDARLFQHPAKLPTLPRIILPVPACAMKGRWDFGKQRAGTARQFGETPSVHARSEDSLRFCPYRLPGEGRDPCQPWAPAFAGVTSCWRER